MTLESIESKVDDALSAPEASEGNSAAPAEETSDSVNAEMLAFLKADNEEPAPEAKAQPAEGDEPEAQAKADESDEGEEAEVDAKSEDDVSEDGAAKKKPSGWQRSKQRFEKKIAKLEESVAQREQRVAELEERESKWEHVSSMLQQRLEEAERVLSARESRLTELGAGPDPAEARIAELERRYREREAALEQQQREFELRQKRSKQQQEQQRIAAIQAEVGRIAEAHGIDADELAVRAAGLAKAARYRNQPAPRLDDVAKELVGLQRLRAGQSTERQAEVSKQAPPRISGARTSPVSPNFEATTEGMASYLKSLGQI